VLGALLLLVAAKEWRDRPKEGEEPPTPKWMATVDQFGPGKALGAGGLLSGLNPKNLLLAVSAAAAIAQTGIAAGQQVVAYAVFALIATVGVAAPVVIFFALGDRAPRLLASLKDWMSRNNAVIMAVLLLVIGVKLIGDGIAGLSG
jgi:threonine/homoserine/homoserine lactone efflux protein